MIQRIVPRMVLDISWSDVGAGLAWCLVPDRWAPTEEAVEAAFGDGGALVGLTIRSGLDVMLTAQGWPTGSEVLISALTIPPVVEILRAHGLIPVPVDLDPRTGAPDLEDFERARTEHTVAVLIAHLFGARLDLDGVAAWAADHGLLLWEDCAHAWLGDGWCGHPAAQVSFFSFGPIKTATAFGGGVWVVRDQDLMEGMRRLRDAQPRRSHTWCAARFAKYALVRAMVTPWSSTVLHPVLGACGVEPDDLIMTLVRGVPRDAMLQRVRWRPPYAMLALLRRRLASDPSERIAARRKFGELVLREADGVEVLGGLAPNHTHWMIPLIVSDPARARAVCLEHGFDATTGGSTMGPVPAPPERPGAIPMRARAAFEGMLYFPVHADVEPERLSRVFAALRAAVGETPALGD